jgi:RNA polymerase-binding transcription factor DksA
MKDQLEDLRKQFRNIQERVLKYENELRQPLAKDLEESAVDESSREILYGLYKVEKENLAKLESEIRELI